jgi:hypothetical protein
VRVWISQQEVHEEEWNDSGGGRGKIKEFPNSSPVADFIAASDKVTGLDCEPAMNPPCVMSLMIYSASWLVLFDGAG